MYKNELHLNKENIKCRSFVLMRYLSNQDSFNTDSVYIEHLSVISLAFVKKKLNKVWNDAKENNGDPREQNKPSTPASRTCGQCGARTYTKHSGEMIFCVL